MAKSEKLSSSEDIKKPPTAAEVAFTKTEEMKNEEEAILGKTLGNDIWNILSNQKEEQKHGEELRSMDVDTQPLQTPQYMPEQQREELQQEINSLGHTPETASMAIAKDTLKQIETTPGLAWVEPKEDAPRGRERVHISPLEEESLIQVETKLPVGEVTELHFPVLNETVSGEEVKTGDHEDPLEKYRAALKAGDIEKALKYEQAALVRARELQPIRENILPKPEGTPKENREGFLKVMARVKEKFGFSERAGKLKTFLSGRLNELNAEAQKMSDFEKTFRAMGEIYTKLGWKSKLAVGVSLGVGAGVFSTVSMPAALACLLGVATQRTFGLASSFLKFEKNTQDTKWGKEKAMGKAILYSAAMTGAMVLLIEGVKEGMEYAREHGWSDATHEWLKEHWPLGEAKLPVHHEVQGMVTEELSKMPIVDASRLGYEGTLMDAFAKVHQPGFHVPINLDPHSDLGRLLSADNHSIGKVAHEIAIKNGFYHADGTSSVVHPHNSLTFDEKGNTLFTSGHETVAPASQTVDAQTTPPLHTPELHSTSDSPSQWSPDVHHKADGITETHETFDPTKAYMQNGPLDTINLHGVTVSPHEPHLYVGLNTKGEQNIFAYGSTYEDKKKMIEEFLTRNPDKIVYTEDTQAHRVLFHSLEGKVLEGPAMRSQGGFLGLSSTFMQPPNPDEFVEILP